MLRTILSLIVGGALAVAYAFAQPPDTLWTQTFGGSSLDKGHSVQQTSDGGYIIAGYTTSYGAGGYDVYLVKTDAAGNEVWSQTFGGSDDDFGYSVQQTSDGGYIIAGETESYSAMWWESDVYLIKTDAAGNELWSHTFGGNNPDAGYSAQQTSDGGYIITGYTTSYGAGYNDVYLIKTDAAGNEIWSQISGGSSADVGRSVQQTSDGGYIIAGWTHFYGAVLSDFYLGKTDAVGNEVWSQTFGGSGWDFGYSVQQTSDGGYIIAGYTGSYGAGSRDVYLIRLAASSPPTPVVMTSFDAVFVDSGVMLTWSTASEIECYGWIVERRQGDGAYQEISPIIPGHGTIEEPRDYSFLDSNVQMGTTYEYRLKQIDISGSTTLSDPIMITVIPIAPEYLLSQNYPNPFNPTTVLSFQLSISSRINIAVFDISGRKVKELVNGWRDAGVHEVTFDGTGLASGIYVYQLQVGDFTASGKMVLMK